MPAPEPELPEPDGPIVESFLVRLRGRLSSERRMVLATDRSQRALADRPDVERIASMRSTPDHMLRIGARTGVTGARRRHGGWHGVRCRACFSSAASALSRPGPTAGAARMRAEIAAHTHASVAATLDRFGGASWLTEREVDDFENWPLELHKLTLLPPPPELAGHVVLVTGAASGIGRDVARDLAARGAHLVLADIDGDGLEELEPLGRRSPGTSPTPPSSTASCTPPSRASAASTPSS